MKKILFSAFPVLAIAAIIIGTNDPLPIGAPMPNAELKMKDVSGKEISLEAAKKKNGLLVMFSCNTCPYVIKNQSRTIEAAKHAQANNVGVAILNSNEAYRGNEDSYEAMKQYAADQQYEWYYLVDQNHVMADAFGANRTPECFLFDKKGILVYHGAIDDNPNDASSVGRKHLIEAINELTGGKEISLKVSRSVGCTIKRLR
ncbi:MAG TPA: redoxin family protein [Chitinophagaceae bacterium]|nr:redoxin family protein [Chitinophagaceae bacterium]